jgi:hypothetical protein
MPHGEHAVLHCRQDDQQNQDNQHDQRFFADCSVSRLRLGTLLPLRVLRAVVRSCRIEYTPTDLDETFSAKGVL